MSDIEIAPADIGELITREIARKHNQFDYNKTEKLLEETIVTKEKKNRTNLLYK